MEVVLSVLLCTIADDPALRNSHVTPAIVVASQVCSRWRSLALSHSQCWASVNMCARQWARVFLDRSENLPLSLTAWEHPTNDQLNLFKPHLSRVRELTLRSATSEPGKSFAAEPDSILRSPTSMRRLESLCLEDQPQYDYRAAAPLSLRRVIMQDGCYISPLFPILKANLVHLELTRCYPAEEPSRDAVQSILLGLLHLQTLVLDYAQKSYTLSASTPQARPEPVMLPQLRQLHLRDTLANLVRRSQLLQIPREAQVTMASEEPVSIATLGVVAVLASTLTRHTTAVMHTLAVDAPVPDTCTGRVVLSYQNDQGSRELARMELATGAGHAPIPCILRKLLGTGQLHVHSLHVSHGHFFSPCAWTDTYGQVPAVKRIAVTGQANIANALLQALQTGAYPGLKELMVADVAVGGQEGVDLSVWTSVQAARPTLDARAEKCFVRCARPLAPGWDDIDCCDTLGRRQRL